jgi:hypothetical protein
MAESVEAVLEFFPGGAAMTDDVKRISCRWHEFIPGVDHSGEVDTFGYTRCVAVTEMTRSRK